MTAVAAIPVRHNAILLTGDNPGTHATKEQALRALFTQLRRTEILGSTRLQAPPSGRILASRGGAVWGFWCQSALRWPRSTPILLGRGLRSAPPLCPKPSPSALPCAASGVRGHSTHNTRRYGHPSSGYQALSGWGYAL